MRAKSLVACFALKDAATEALSRAGADGPRALDQLSEESSASTVPSEKVDDMFSKIDSWQASASREGSQHMLPTAV